MVGVVTAAVVIGTAVSIDQSKKASKAQKKANTAQRSINQLQNKQNKRQFLRAFRQAQAQALQNAVTAGVGLESSAFQGTVASQATQAEVAVKEFKEADRLGAVQTSALNQAASAQFKAQVGSSVASFASQFAGYKPGGGTTDVPKVTASKLPPGP